MHKYLLLFILLLANSVYADIIINEVMADPSSCSDSVCEWIELYNNNEISINMTNWMISDESANDSLESSSGDSNIILPGNSFALIVDDDSRVFHNFNVGENIIWIYVDDDAIGNGLSNDGEENIILYDNKNMTINNVTYTTTASGNSFALINGEWKESSPTPGRSNENNQSHSNDYSKISINEFLANPIGDDDSSMPDGEWVELYNKGNDNLDLLGFKLKDSSKKEILIDNVHVKESTIIDSKDYLIVYINGFSGFLNNDGSDRIGLYDLSDNLIDEISYSNSKEGLSWSKIEEGWQITESTPEKKNKDNSTIKEIEDSSIKIENIYDLGSNDKAEWGSNIRVKLLVYKGDTEKDTISAYIKGSERISKISKTNFYEKFNSYTITLPIQIALNCDNKYKDDNYDIVVEGLNSKDAKEIKIAGQSKECRSVNKEVEEKKESIKKEGLKEDINNNVNKITGRIIYENKSKEASRLNVFIFIALLIILSLVLLYERKDIG